MNHSPLVFLSSSTRQRASSCSRSSMLLFPTPKSRRVLREKRRISFHLFPLLNRIPTRRGNRNWKGGPRPGKEDDTWFTRRWAQLCWREFKFLFPSFPPHYQCCPHRHSHLPCPFFVFSITGATSLPENSSPRSIRASFTASYPCSTTVGFMPKYTVNTGP